MICSITRLLTTRYRTLQMPIYMFGGNFYGIVHFNWVFDFKVTTTMHGHLTILMEILTLILAPDQLFSGRSHSSFMAASKTWFFFPSLHPCFTSNNGNFFSIICLLSFLPCLLLFFSSLSSPLKAEFSYDFLIRAWQDYKIWQQVVTSTIHLHSVFTC